MDGLRGTVLKSINTVQEMDNALSLSTKICISNGDISEVKMEGSMKKTREYSTVNSSWNEYRS